MIHHLISNRRNVIGLVLAGMSLYGMGCALDNGESQADPEDVRLGVAEQGAGGEPGTNNHLLPECFWDHGAQQTARDLGDAALTNNLGQLPSMPYLPTPEATGDLQSCRHDFLDVLIGCALPQGEVVEDSSDGSRRYSGWGGIASNWKTQPLNATEKAFITGCMLERLNALGMINPILLEGDHEAILPVPEAQDDYPIVESTAWGNLFDSTVELNPTRDPQEPTPRAFDAFVCSHMDTCTAVPTLGRTCYDDGCGMTALGSCEDLETSCLTNPNLSACVGRTNAVTARVHDNAVVCDE